MNILEKIIDRFATPAGLAIVVGLIIWLVQLNIEALNGRQERTTMLSEIVELRKDYHEQALILAAITQGLKSTIAQQSDLRDRMTRNESWIGDNRDRINRAEQ